MNRAYLVSVEHSDETGQILEVIQTQYETTEQAQGAIYRHIGNPLIRAWFVKVAVEE